MLSKKVATDDFERFLKENGERLVDALTALFGPTVGNEAAADALSYCWEHWDRVREMANPVGYLYVMARGRVHRARGRRFLLLDPVDSQSAPWVEPGLPAALERLSEKQRVVVMLIHCFQWSFKEVAEMMGVSKGTVQLHERRAMRRLRSDLGVEA
jgi:DNA-directed RNA polymerase specialized sigma24 family protein